MGHVAKFEGLSERISTAFRLSESEIFKAGSLKFPKSVEYNEINSFVSIIETSEQEDPNNETLTEILLEPINKQLLETYTKYFLVKRNSKKIIKLFSRENSRLIKSDLKGVSFSIKDILLRLKSGYKVYKYTHKEKLRKNIWVHVDQSMLKIKSRNKCPRLISFESIYGVILGCDSFYFKKIKPKIDLNCGIIHNEYNCFSIITDSLTLDLASTSEQSLYDICLGVSWLSYHYCSLPTCVPYTKCNLYKDTLIISIIAIKLRVAAKARYMSVFELFLVFSNQLAICKTLMELGRSLKPVMKILNKRFDSEGKIFRFVVRSLINVVREQMNKAQLRTDVRVSLLANIPTVSKNRWVRRTSVFITRNKRRPPSPLTFIAFFVPFSTKIFEKQRKNVDTGRRRYTSILRHASMFGSVEMKK